ncbi:MAG: V-type ATP synthase subunit E [Clostridia bacterium]|nr:V-type ATP synthase subunit E [Clostridia bacterium]
MENLERLKERITGEAREQAEKIQADGASQAARIAAEAKSRADQLYARALENARKAAAEEERRAEIARSLDERNAILRAKGEMVDALLAEVPGRIHALPDPDYLALIKTMMVRLAPEGDVEVVVATADRSRITPELLKQVGAELAARGRKTSLRLSSKTEDISGGFLLKGAAVEVDCSLDSLLASCQDDLAPLVAGTLFGR